MISSILSKIGSDNFFRKSYWFILIAFVFLSILYLYSTLFFGLDSIFDDGFYLLQINQKNSTAISLSFKYSKWLLGFLSDSIFHLKALRITLQIATLLIVFIVFTFIAKKEKILINMPFILATLFLFSYPSFIINSNIPNYNHYQQFFSSLILLNLVLTFYANKESLNKRFLLYTFLLGFISAFSIANYITGSILMIGFIFGLYIIVLRPTFSLFIRTSFFYALGMVSGIILFEVILEGYIDWIFDLKRLIISMTSEHGGFESNSTYESIFKYFNTILMYLLLSIGLLKVSNQIIHKSKLKYRILFCIPLLVFLILNFNHPVFYYLFFIISICSFYTFNSKGIFLYVSLFFAPLMFSFGTNTVLVSKSLFFMHFWWLLAQLLISKNQVEILNRKSHFILLVLTAGILYFTVYTLNNQKNWKGNFLTSTNYIDNLPRLKRVGLRIEQVEYFNRVREITDRYRRDSLSTALSFYPDHATWFVLNCEVKPLFYLANWMKHDRYLESYSSPDFIILQDWENKILLNLFERLNWKFPQNYDSYEIGSPEIYDEPHSKPRVLYCKKRGDMVY